MSQRTQLYNVHVQAGAKIIPFGGFDMPMNYPKGIIAEHHAVRKSCGIFDVSHMGEVEVRGTDALAFLQKLTVNDVALLKPGKAQYSAMCKPDGGIVDDLLVYQCERDGDAYYLLVINAANITKDTAWIRSQAEGFNVEISDVSAEYNLLAVQGPKSIEILQTLTDVNLHDIAYYHHTFGALAGTDMLLSRTGYTGEIGFELYFKGDEAIATHVWNAILAAGAEHGIEPVGLGARDTLRLEKGFSLYGNDIDETTHTIEAGLGWITKLNKNGGTDFNGRSVLVAAKEQVVQRKLVGFVVQAERMIPRSHFAIHAPSGEKIGEVTSGGMSITSNKAIGLGYVETAFAAVGSAIMIDIRGKHVPAEVVKVPFV